MAHGRRKQNTNRKRVPYRYSGIGVQLQTIRSRQSHFKVGPPVAFPEGMQHQHAMGSKKLSDAHITVQCNAMQSTAETNDHKLNTAPQTLQTSSCKRTRDKFAATGRSVPGSAVGRCREFHPSRVATEGFSESLELVHLQKLICDQALQLFDLFAV